MRPDPVPAAAPRRNVQPRRGRRARPGVEFQVALGPEVPLEVNGKFRVSRSLVESAYDGIDWDRRRAMELAALQRSAPKT